MSEVKKLRVIESKDFSSISKELAEKIKAVLPTKKVKIKKESAADPYRDFLETEAKIESKAKALLQPNKRPEASPVKLIKNTPVIFTSGLVSEGLLKQLYSEGYKLEFLWGYPVIMNAQLIAVHYSMIGNLGKSYDDYGYPIPAENRPDSDDACYNDLSVGEEDSLAAGLYLEGHVPKDLTCVGLDRFSNRIGEYHYCLMLPLSFRSSKILSSHLDVLGYSIITTDKYVPYKKVKSSKKKTEASKTIKRVMNTDTGELVKITREEAEKGGHIGQYEIGTKINFSKDPTTKIYEGWCIVGKIKPNSLRVEKHIGKGRPPKEKTIKLGAWEVEIVLDDTDDDLHNY